MLVKQVQQAYDNGMLGNMSCSGEIICKSTTMVDLQDFKCCRSVFIDVASVAQVSFACSDARMDSLNDNGTQFR
jgi:hypothetical protein